jgi:hypothetical protein
MNDLLSTRDPVKRGFDALECAMIELSEVFPVECPVHHDFADNMYIRTIHIPAGTLLTSMTHLTKHPFVVTKGVCDVIDTKGKVQRITAPHIGMTLPGTRRIIQTVTDVVWTTFHATEITDPDQWLAENTVAENNHAPEHFLPQCFSRKELACHPST